MRNTTNAMETIDCAIDGRWLSTIAYGICIVDISESAPQMQVSVLDNGIYDGGYVTKMRRQKLSVTVTFEIHERIASRRKEIAAEVCIWAHDGWLTLHDRPYQRLYVVCDSLPAVPSSLKWTDKMTVGFSAYAFPYWQNTIPVKASFSGKEGAASLRPDGLSDCFLQAQIRAQGAAVNALTLSANGRTYSFIGLALNKGQTFEIGYAYEGGRRIQTMKIGDVSVLSKRTPESADDILLHPKQKNEITVSADQPVDAVFLTYGLYR